MTWAESESKEAATVVEEDGVDEDEEDTCFERCIYVGNLDTYLH